MTPVANDEMTSPISVGNIIRPDTVTVVPLTAWNQRGSYESTRVKKEEEKNYLRQEGKTHIVGEDKESSLTKHRETDHSQHISVADDFGRNQGSLFSPYLHPCEDS